MKSAPVPLSVPKSASDYWIRAFDDSTANNVTYHDSLVSGVLTQTSNYSKWNGPTTLTNPTWFYQYSSRYNGGGYSNLVTSSGLPSGLFGVYSTVPGSSLLNFDVTLDTMSRDLAGRYIDRCGTSSDVTDPYCGIRPSTGGLDLPITSNQRGMFIQNLRLQKFCLTFAIKRVHTDIYCGMNVFFNGQDQDNNNSVTIFHSDTAKAPIGSVGGGTQTIGNVPNCTASQIMWVNVTYDGTTLTVKQQVSGTEPAFSSWASVSTGYSSTHFATTGGLIGFSGNNAYPSLSAIKLRSYDTSTSAFDIMEFEEPGTVDGTGFTTGDTLTNDNNGNLTYDGTQMYTYDAWNRLMTISHAYRDSSGTFAHGQTSTTNSYDAQGRRITKAIVGTGIWDCTYNYYMDGQSVIEEQNGSAQTIKQFVWGKKYIDELIQTSLNSSPATQSTCDTPYWAMQDANWNVLGIANSSGVLTERYEYTPYGERQVFISPGTNDPLLLASTFASSRFVTSGSVTQPYGVCEVGHQGLMQDEECGLVYNRARCLSPALGRWLSRDTIGYRDGLALYQYEQGRSPNILDPLGQCTTKCDSSADQSNERGKDAAKEAAKEVMKTALDKMKEYAKELAGTSLTKTERDATEKAFETAKSQYEKAWPEFAGADVPDPVNLAISGINALSSSACTGWYKKAMDAIDGKGDCTSINGPATGGAFANCSNEMLNADQDKGYIIQQAFESMANKLADACARCKH